MLAVRDLLANPRFNGARRGRRVFIVYGIPAVFPFVGGKGRYWQESELVLLWFLFQAGVIQPERDPTLPRTPFGDRSRKCADAGPAVHSWKADLTWTLPPVSTE